jgi:2-iminobutanoate/2-iminopropanoate deaminase
MVEKEKGVSCEKNEQSFLGNIKPLGPYSLFRIEDNFVFLAGQIGVDGEVLKETLEEQLEQALKNIYRILVSIGLTPADIVKAIVFTTRIDQAQKINAIWENFFRKYSDVFPARTFVGVSALPRGAAVEIDVIAHLKDERALFGVGKHFFLTKDFLKSHEYFERAWRKKGKYNELGKAFAILSAGFIKLQEGKFQKTLFTKATELLKNFVSKDKIKSFKDAVSKGDKEKLFDLSSAILEEIKIS